MARVHTTALSGVTGRIRTARPPLSAIIPHDVWGFKELAKNGSALLSANDANILVLAANPDPEAVGQLQCLLWLFQDLHYFPRPGGI